MVGHRESNTKSEGDCKSFEIQFNLFVDVSSQGLWKDQADPAQEKMESKLSAARFSRLVLFVSFSFSSKNHHAQSCDTGIE